jgi:hypothetical protein
MMDGMTRLTAMFAVLSTPHAIREAVIDPQSELKKSYIHMIYMNICFDIDCLKTCAARCNLDPSRTQDIASWDG